VLRQTTVVAGVLAYRSQRAAAARENAVGREIATLSQVATRLIGGFVEAADAEVLFPLIRSSLEQGGFSKLAQVANLPGTPRAVMATLRKVWEAGLDLKSLSDGAESLVDLAMIEERVRRALPPAWLLPPDLCTQAIDRVDRASRVLGDIVMDGIIDVPPLWRPLVRALMGHVVVEWRTSGPVDRAWFKGRIVERPLAPPSVRRVESCADARSEIVEALRWAREQLSTGHSKAADLAIVAASTADYDEHMMGLVREAGLPLHFGDGLPALSTRAGQCCAALADILLRGLAQDRVRRVLNALPRRGSLQLLPPDWSKGLRSGASLSTLAQWQAALVRSRDRRADTDLAERVLLPVLARLEKGLDEALDLGEMLLDRNALAIWKNALRAAPPEALAMSLQQIRVPDDTDPSNSIVWCSAEQLAASPRPVVRLLGLSVKSWPRNSNDDPLLPDHVLSRRTLQPRSATEQDRASFFVIQGHATHLAISRSRRTARGGLQAASPLWPKEAEVELARLRVPVHAYSESDRLLARPTDAATAPRVARSRACWSAWHSEELTAYDGMIAAEHRSCVRSFERPLTASHLRLLLRDPQAFVWTRCLDWRAKEFSRRPLAIDGAAFGELVHELIAASVRRLDAMGGVQRTSSDEREIAVLAAVEDLDRGWQLERAIPPRSLWNSTLALARRMTLHAIEVDEDLPFSLDSWTEVSFGAANANGAPWPDDAQVPMEGTPLRLVGRIDRLDLAKTHSAARITDYKTAIPMPDSEGVVLDGGRELQRVLYATAVKQLVPDAGRIVARLLYLGSTLDARSLAEDELDGAMADLARYASQAIDGLRRGHAIPGPDAFDKYSRHRLALPADLQLYRQIKGRALAEAGAALEEARTCR